MIRLALICDPLNGAGYGLRIFLLHLTAELFGITMNKGGENDECKIEGMLYAACNDAQPVWAGIGNFGRKSFPGLSLSLAGNSINGGFCSFGHDAKVIGSKVMVRLPHYHHPLGKPNL